MKSRVNRILCVATALAVAVALHAQTLRTTANVPFPFYAGGQLMPQGTYYVNESGDGHIAWVRAADQNASQALTTFAVAGKKTIEPARLVFHKYGNEYFLSQIWNGESNTGLALGVSRREKELARAGVPVTLAEIHLAIHN